MVINNTTLFSKSRTKSIFLVKILIKFYVFLILEKHYSLGKIEQFTTKISLIYGDASDSILKTHYLSHPKTFRINFLQSNEAKVISSLQQELFVVEKLKFPDAFVSVKVPQAKKLSESRVALKNEIYIQELSSMLPALLLDLSKDDSVLDLCAAPGSKTSQVAVLTRNKSKIVAVEKSRGRFFKTKKILEDQGVTNTELLNLDANHLLKYRPEFVNYFDKILVDVPCTNEGNIDLQDKDALKFWHPNEAKKLSKLQKGLLNNALKMLKRGGTLIYSTCTYSVEENELVVNWMLERSKKLESESSDFGNLTLEEIKVPLDNLMNGIVEWKGKTLNPGIAKTKRVLPNEYFRGFYLAKFRKN